MSSYLSYVVLLGSATFHGDDYSVCTKQLSECLIWRAKRSHVRHAQDRGSCTRSQNRHQVRDVDFDVTRLLAPLLGERSKHGGGAGQLSCREERVGTT